ncbi:MAG TPA: polysaccharide biosynthesis tyrosine autokinase [Rubricoccaceae bacterium]|jgi:tyrosine-protein kinase Etk/Wzc
MEYVSSGTPGPRPFGPDGGPPDGTPRDGGLRDPNPRFGYPVDRGAQLREWVDVAYRGRWIILAALVAVVVPTVLYALSLPDQYRADTVLLVQTGEGSGLSDVLPEGAADALGGGQGRQIENEILVLRQSDALAAQTAAELLRRREAAGRLPILQTADGSAPSVDVVAARLRRALAITPEGRDVDAVRVSATSTSPVEAALVADLYAGAYLLRTRQGSRASVNATRTFLEGQVDSLGGELAAREEAVRAYMTREGAVRLDEEADRLVTQIAALEAQRDEARIAGQMKGASAAAIGRELGQIEPRLGERLSARIAPGAEAEITAAQTEIRRLQGELETYYAQNPELRDASDADVPSFIRRDRAQIDRLRRRAATLSDQVVQGTLGTGGVDPSDEGVGRVAELRRRRIDAQIEQSGLDAEASTIAARIAQYEAELSRIPSQAVELARLTRDRQSTEGLTVALQERLQEARVAEQSELGYAEVVRAAAVPAVPFAPNRRRTVILGVLFGLGLGLGLALLRARMDHRLHRPEDLRDRGVTVLGTLPNMDALVRDDFGGAETIEVGGRLVNTRMAVLLTPLSQAAESYRSLRTSVQFSRPDVVVRTIVVTSASPGEGKSTTAANLAVTMAQAGRRVLLVDGDLRRPRAHALFGTAKTPGLSDVLFQPLTAGLLPPGLAPSGVDDLDLLPAGAFAPNPSELLGSMAFRDRLAAWAAAYDVVVVDAPPVLAATDAVLLSTQADATVVVVRAGQTKDFELDRALDALHSVGAPVIGTVFNGFDASQAYGYKYRYTTGYSHKYGYGYVEAPASARGPAA